jgi:ribonuclease BN (tRNA processing enzyme)
VEGLGFFGPIWDPDCEIHLWGPPTPERSLREDITRLMSPPLFPVHLDEIPSKLFFHDVTRMEWELGSTRIIADPIIHRGPAVGFRLEDGGSTIAYMSDHEPAIGVDLANVLPEWVSGYGLAQGADVLFHDAQYTEEEYASRVGWGHSTVDQMMAFGRLTKVGKLYMFHHDPMHTDQKLQEMLLAARERWEPDPQTLALAYEGMEISLGERSPVMQKR